MKQTETWDSSERWYTGCVGEKGHAFHQSVVLPGALRLLDLKAGQSLLDLGCGQGVLARALPAQVEYWGIDSSKALLSSAKKLTLNKNASFVLGDATAPLDVEKTDFDCVSMILSLQNMENPKEAIRTAARHLKKGGRLLIVLNHPCFRIPRQSAWGVDETAKLQYRRMNGYMSEQKIPIQTHPGKGETSPTTVSYHHPLSSYFGWLAANELCVAAMEEWISDKKSEGPKARMEDRARREFPLFLALLAHKNRCDAEVVAKL